MRMFWEMKEQLLTGGVLSLMAGLCTGLGAALALFLKKTDTRALTYALGASAGVMVYISFMELTGANGLFWGHFSVAWP